MAPKQYDLASTIKVLAKCAELRALRPGTRGRRQTKNLMSKSQDAKPGSQQQEVVPRSVKLMLEKYNKHYAETPPHKRKRVDVACVINATSIKRAAEELEELARTIREGGVGYVGSGGGYYVTIAWATTKRHNAALSQAATTRKDTNAK